MRPSPPWASAGTSPGSCSCSLFFIGALVLVAQSWGAGDRGKAERAAGEALTMNIALSIPLGLLAWQLAPWLVGLLGGEGTGPLVEGLAVEYFRARLWGLPFLYASLVYGAVYRGVGVTRPVLYGTIVFASLNATLDPVLIYGLLGAPRLGIAGAGYASSIANAVYLAALAVQAERALGFRVRPLRPTEIALLEARVGGPALAERLAFVAGNLAYLGVVARCGEDALAAHTIGVRIESLAFLPIFSIGEAAATLAGQEVGQGRPDRAKHAGWEVAKLNLLAGLATGLLIIVASRFIPAAFTSDPRVEELAATYLVIAAITEPFFGVAISLTMAIRGAGNTVVPTIINLTSLYLLRVVPATILPQYLPPDKCVLGAWASMAIDTAGRATLSAIVYRQYFHRLAKRLV